MDKKCRHIYMGEDTHRKLKVYSAKEGIALGKAIEKLLKIAEEKEKK